MEEKQGILVKRVNDLCKQKGLTYYTLSYKSGVPLSTLMHLMDESVQNPRLNTIVRLCVGMKITLAEFFDTEDFVELVENTGIDG